METCAVAVDKTEFPSLLKRLWGELFEVKHLKAGFRKAALCPLTTEAITKSSFAPSLPHTLPPPESQSPKKGDQDAGADTHTHLIHVQVKCCECFSEKQLTPVRVYLWGYFAHLLGKKRTERKTACRKLKALNSGEALTADDIFERLKEDKQKVEKEKLNARNE